MQQYLRGLNDKLGVIAPMVRAGFREEVGRGLYATRQFTQGDVIFGWSPLTVFHADSLVHAGTCRGCGKQLRSPAAGGGGGFNGGAQSQGCPGCADFSAEKARMLQAFPYLELQLGTSGERFPAMIARLVLSIVQEAREAASDREEYLTGHEAAQETVTNTLLQHLMYPPNYKEEVEQQWRDDCDALRSVLLRRSSWVREHRETAAAAAAAASAPASDTMTRSASQDLSTDVTITRVEPQRKQSNSSAPSATSSAQEHDTAPVANDVQLGFERPTRAELSFLTHEWYAETLGRISMNHFQHDDVDHIGRVGVVSALYSFPSFINHSCRPNTHAVWQDGMGLFCALRDIEAGEELFVSYVTPLTEEEAASTESPSSSTDAVEKTSGMTSVSVPRLDARQVAATWPSALTPLLVEAQGQTSGNEKDGEEQEIALPTNVRFMDPAFEPHTQEFLLRKYGIDCSASCSCGLRQQR